MATIDETLMSLGIAFERVEHAPLNTCAEAYAAMPGRDSLQTKNIFLRDKRGRRHVLLVTTCEHVVDVKKFAEQSGADRLSFASPERMMKYLGVEPGSVTILGLINDKEHGVELFVDREVWEASVWRCHPLVNTATLLIPRRGIETFLAHTGHEARVLDLR
jgi:Ala-tRNA(Pro) deacylase